MRSLRLCVVLAYGAVALLAGAADVEWKWDTSGRIQQGDPVVQSAVCQTTFDSRLCAKGMADPVRDGLQKFDSRLFMSLISEGINFKSTETGLFLLFR